MSALIWVDVFATGPATGNQLAVVLDADGWDAAGMQRLAFELGLSETTFVLSPDHPEADLRVRVFTPASELPMAGHPIVGTAWVLRATERCGDEAVLETGAGLLRVRVDGDVATMRQAAPTRVGAVDAAEVARACGLAGAEWPETAIWSTGLPQLMLPVSDESVLAGARPDMSALAALSARDGWLGVSVYALVEHGQGRAVASVRHFAPGLAVPEDPVTGSAAGGLGACLASAGLAAGGVLRLVVRQGAALGRPGEVAVRVRCRDGAPEAVWVGGRVIPVLEGRVLGPAAAAASEEGA
jgi:trans-2,3-dihydro-3-hydroxyanthranilate isomerase